MLRQGVYLPPSPYEAMFLSLAHGKKHLDQALEAAGTFTVR
jgi:glutamate-1-semialdehyde aminotransferase